MRVDFLDVKADQVAERVVTVAAPSGPAFRITGLEANAASFIIAPRTSGIGGPP